MYTANPDMDITLLRPATRFHQPEYICSFAHLALWLPSNIAKQGMPNSGARRVTWPLSIYPQYWSLMLHKLQYPKRQNNIIRFINFLDIAWSKLFNSYSILFVGLGLFFVPHVHRIAYFCRWDYEYSTLLL